MATTNELSILVVDDNPEDRKSLKRILESAAYSVVEAGSGKDALAALEKTTFEFMILDLGMPDMDGFDVLRTVRYKHPELRIIVVSGFMQGRMLEPAKLLGANATLDKNLARDLLLPMVRSLLKNPKP
jgi:two-component system, OmpR family, KDP operon response regulator KdpE